MALWQDYFTPDSVASALALLEQHSPDVRIVAGGTDLILMMQQGGHAPVTTLVDVTRIPGMADIGQQEDAEGNWIVLGAAVTHAQIEAHPLLRQHAAALTESCGVVGGPQVRNVATLGGNVAHALPAADGTIGLLALDAQVQICTWDGSAVTSEWKPLLSIFAGPGKNTLTRRQMIAAFRFHTLPARTGSAFDRIMRPQGVALPILGLAARLRVDDAGRRVEEATVAIGPAGPIPFRAHATEAILADAPVFDAATVEVAIAAAHKEARFRSSKHRASRAYRDEVLEVLLRRVLGRAFERACATLP